MRRNQLITVIEEHQAIRSSHLEVVRKFSIPFEKLIQTENIVIVTGVRRCGKSTLLQYIRSHYPQNNYYLNFDDERLLNFTVNDFQMLMEILTELYEPQKVCFFDEIQNIIGWERFVRRLHDQGYKIYLTGSNAKMLSQELGTHLTGRFLKVELYPFSLSEFLKFKQLDFRINRLTTTDKAKLNQNVKKYIYIGGFPQYVKEEIMEYLQSLYENILYRDIVARYKLPSEYPIKQLALYFASNIGKEITFNSLRKLLKLGSTNTVSEYCQFFENCYLFFLVKRFSVSLKAQSASPKKVYAIDTGMAHAIGFRQSNDDGRLLENLVYIELKRRNTEIYYHREKKECDFVVCVRNKIQHLIQVCYDLTDPKTMDREIAGLVEAMNSYNIAQGLIITLHDQDFFEVTEHQKKFQIKIVTLAEWLLAEDTVP